MLRSFTCLPRHTSSAASQLVCRNNRTPQRAAFTPLSITSLYARFHSSLLWSCRQHAVRMQRATPANRHTDSGFRYNVPRLACYSSGIASPLEHSQLSLRDTRHLSPSVDYQLEPIHFRREQPNHKKTSSTILSATELESHDDNDVVTSGWQLAWKQRPRTVLLVKKPADQATEKALVDVAHWLNKQDPPLNVVIERKVAATLQEQLPFAHVITEGEHREYERIVDFVVTIGGDGTILHVSSLFNGRVPPIVSFSMGTLGFLLPFHFKDYVLALSNVIHGNASLLPRLRLECTAFTATGQKMEQADRIQVMNEVNLHRGRYPHLSAVSCYVDGEFLTDAVADGLIIATPTGSTAYSLSAGGPIVHPSVPSLLITPVCPLSLSFRPVLLPADARIKVRVSTSSRGEAELTVDGRELCLLSVGSYVEIKRSNYPMLCVNRINEGVDWVRDINQMLKFNQGFANKHQLLMRTDADWE